ncbi:MAG: hypothetical protein EOP23_04125 [Hyphomicrobiales bacterium]|nr:MAG: hypothetical protein EOP23_04125 [Hyphomicrobiales bacterium]
MLATVLIVALSAAGAVAQKPQEVDALGCWQTEMRTVPRQGSFYAGYCFLKGGLIAGGELHGVSGSSIEDRWRRLDRTRVMVGGKICSLRRSGDGAKLQISGCPKYAREWFKADPVKVLPPSP